MIDDETFQAALTRARRYAEKIARLENQETVLISRITWLESRLIVLQQQIDDLGLPRRRRLRK